MSDSERFDRAIEKVLSARSPRREVSTLDPEEQRLVQMAQRLRGSQGQSPSPEFVDRLHARLFHQPRRVSRRAAVLSALGTLAAGVAAGIGLQHSREGSSTRPLKQQGLDVHNGKWFRVTDVAALPAGTVHAFTAGPHQPGGGGLCLIPHLHARGMQPELRLTRTNLDLPVSWGPL